MMASAATKTSKDKTTGQVESAMQAQAHQSAFSDTQAGIMRLQELAGNRAVNQAMDSENSNPHQAVAIRDGMGNTANSELKPLPSANTTAADAKGLPSAVRSELTGGGGSPLEPGIRSFMESRFGYNFGPVRVHTGAQAADSARKVHAAAYTVGKDVVFGERYAQGTVAGKELMAHELAHVIQHSRVAPGFTSSTFSQPNDPWERSADASVERHIPINLPPGSPPLVQRQTNPRHARGSAGEQNAAFTLYRFEDGWAVVRGPSGAAGHGVTTAGEDGLFFNVRTRELHIVDNKSLARPGNVSSATAIDPSRNLQRNLNDMIRHVESQSPQDLPKRQRVLRLLRQTKAAIREGRAIPGRVRLVVANEGGRSTGVTRRLRRLGVTFVDVNRPVQQRPGKARPSLMPQSPPPQTTSGGPPSGQASQGAAPSRSQPTKAPQPKVPARSTPSPRVRQNVKALKRFGRGAGRASGGVASLINEWAVGSLNKHESNKAYNEFARWAPAINQLVEQGNVVSVELVMEGPKSVNLGRALGAPTQIDQIDRFFSLIIRWSIPDANSGLETTQRARGGGGIVWTTDIDIEAPATLEELEIADRRRTIAKHVPSDEENRALLKPELLDVFKQEKPQKPLFAPILNPQQHVGTYASRKVKVFQGPVTEIFHDFIYKRELSIGSNGDTANAFDSTGQFEAVESRPSFKQRRPSSIIPEVSWYYKTSRGKRFLVRSKFHLGSSNDGRSVVIETFNQGTISVAIIWEKNKIVKDEK